MKEQQTTKQNTKHSGTDTNTNIIRKTQQISKGARYYKKNDRKHDRKAEQASATNNLRELYKSTKMLANKKYSHEKLITEKRETCHVHSMTNF